MAKNKAELYANQADIQDILISSPEAQAVAGTSNNHDGNPCCILCVVDPDRVFKNEETGDVCIRPYRDNSSCPDSHGFRFNGKPVAWRDKKYSKVMILFLSFPVHVNVLTSWRKWARNRKAREIKIDFLEDGSSFSHEFIADCINRHCKDWNCPMPPQEEVKWNVGRLISMVPVGNPQAESEEIDKDSPDLLSAMFGQMGDLLVRIDVLKEKSKKLLHSDSDENKNYIKNVSEALASDVQYDVDYPLMNHLTRIPRLLLYGESGVGKTLIARYLQSNQKERPVRISIPEFLNKEDDFEYSLFGYAKGTFSDARINGNIGLLLNNVGKVVFLDEIGEANQIIQAKLLAYMDDYMVRPRGWLEAPFFCPTLIVAATNRDLEEDVKRGRFRRDLLNRFTDVETVPPLRERRESLPYIIDILLQQDAINRGRKVKSISANAWEKLQSQDYRYGNVRQLENELTKACENTTQGYRECMYGCDVVIHQ